MAKIRTLFDNHIIHQFFTIEIRIFCQISFVRYVSESHLQDIKEFSDLEKKEFHVNRLYNERNIYSELVILIIIINHCISVLAASS